MRKLLPVLLALNFTVEAQIVVEEDNVFFECALDQYFDTTQLLCSVCP